jgi:vacuolar-type H+-ATPase subunit I/STV1
MKKTRIHALILVCFTIILGLISRKITIFPLWIGDMLYGVMIFFIVSFIYIKKPTRIVATISLALCYLIEFSQLYQAEWINSIRKTLPGRLVLGQGFLWSDLLAYSVGILAVSWILTSRKNKRT